MIFFLFLPSIPADAKKARPGDEKAILYSFVENLSKAQAVRESEDRVIEGRWLGDRFKFEGLPSVADIFTSESVVVDGKTRSAIWLQPLERFESSLTFSGVPAGRVLEISYALPDWTFQGKEVSPVEFEIWIGEKKVFGTRFNTKGWKTKTVDLTLLSLLQRKYRVSFKVRTTDQQPKSLVFYGLVENPPKD